MKYKVKNKNRETGEVREGKKFIKDFNKALVWVEKGKKNYPHLYFYLEAFEDNHREDND